MAVPLLCALAVAACSSSSSSTPKSSSTGSASASKSGTETLTAAVTGSAAAANLNNSNPNAPLNFTKAVWTGPVATSVAPFVLGGDGNKPGDVTWTTPAGKVTVYHAPAAGYTNNNAPPPAVWTKSGTTCHFTSTFSKGSFHYVSGTGQFAGATGGTGSYVLTAVGSAPLDAGKTVCSFPNVGNVTADGAAITFVATGPLAVK
jgi:hypothetical protein